jgi:hypothetical protein
MIPLMLSTSNLKDSRNILKVGVLICLAIIKKEKRAQIGAYCY